MEPELLLMPPMEVVERAGPSAFVGGILLPVLVSAMIRQSDQSPLGTDLQNAIRTHSMLVVILLSHKLLHFCSASRKQSFWEIDLRKNIRILKTSHRQR